MRKFPKPIVVVSKCITFEHVRWDGQIIASDFVEKLKPYINFIPVCPEVEIGLAVPRDPVRIVLVKGEKRLIQPATGLDFTDKINNFASSFLNSLGEVDGFILKNGSPSSGFKNVKIYPTAEKSAAVARGSGFFGEAVLRRFSSLAVEDEKRLLNPRIREHFLTRLFAIGSFREIRNSGSIKELVRFQSDNKLLLTAYSQKELRTLGNIVANQKNKPFIETAKSYENHLLEAFKRMPSTGANINVMTKMVSYFSHELSKEEKAFFLGSIRKYRTGTLPLTACTSVLVSWIIRFRQDYLMKQTFLEPYPEELADFVTVPAKSYSRAYKRHA